MNALWNLLDGSFSMLTKHRCTIVRERKGDELFKADKGGDRLDRAHIPSGRLVFDGLLLIRSINNRINNN